MRKVIINGKEVSVQHKGGAYVTENGVEFDGHFTLWSFSYEPKNYLKESELSGDEYRKGGSAKIFRDGVCVWEEFIREPETAFREISWYLARLQDFRWEEVYVGKKLYNHDVPCVIESIGSNGEITVKTEDGSNFPWAFKIEALKNGEMTEDDDEWKNRDRVHVTSQHLSWYRN